MDLNIYPSFDEFSKISSYDMALVFAEVSSDLETPVSAFLKLKESGVATTPCFLLESAEAEQMWGRYSFLGFDPVTQLICEDGRLNAKDEEEFHGIKGNPVRALFDFVESQKVLVPDDMPFAGGAVGYFAYDILPYIESVKLREKPSISPEAQFVIPRLIVMFDHLRSRMRLCALVPVGESTEEKKENYECAIGLVEGLAEKLSKPLPIGMGIKLEQTANDRAEYPGRKSKASSCESFSANSLGSFKPGRVVSNVSKEKYEEMVKRAKEYIYAGDAFQVVVSQRFSLFGSDPFLIYRHLRAENPSPYMFYLELDGITLVGSSPEALVTRRGRKAIIRPIAGTRPRGSSHDEDLRLELELRSDEKERAEHIMLVDLARNDLGRVCVPGTVRVKGLMEVEKYSHVIHMVSEVEGILDGNYGNYDLLCASFPAGTVVGAPKVRASEIIDELEPEKRGPYAGAVGYISYNGDMDTCITIRTVVVKDDIAHVQAGAGIVADSVPSREYEECQNKALAALRAVQAAEGTSVCEHEKRVEDFSGRKNSRRRLRQ